MLSDDTEMNLTRREREEEYDRARMRCFMSMLPVVAIWFLLLWCIAPSLSRSQAEYYHVKCRLLAWPFVEQRTTTTSVERHNVTTINGTTGDVRIETTEKTNLAMGTYQVVLYFRSDCAPADPYYSDDGYPRGGSIHVFESHNATLAQYYVDTEWPNSTRTEEALARPWDLWWGRAGLTREPQTSIDTWWYGFAIWYAPSLCIWFFILGLVFAFHGMYCTSPTGACLLVPEVMRFFRGMLKEKTEHRRDVY